MPEIIEVKSYSDFIKKNALNKQLLDIKIIRGRYITHGPFEHYKEIKRKLPLKLIKVGGKGKYMYLEFEDNYYIGVTLGLYGGWFFNKKDSDKLIHGLHKDLRYGQDETNNYVESAKKHINVKFIFESGTLSFYDVLSFGTIKIFTSKEELEKKISKIGLDIMDINTTFDMFSEKINKKSNLDKFIGLILLKQNIIAGVGNYLRADALWMSKISPFRKVKNINNDELYKLYYNLRLLTWGSYNRNKGIKLKIIKKTDKLPSDYGRSFFVYYQDEDINKNEVKMEKLYEGSQIRYIHWTPKVQK